ERARQHVEAGGPTGVRLLRQRQSGCRSPALEPGDGAPPAVALQEHEDAAVQRLRRPGRQHVRWHGPEEALLGRDRSPHVIVVTANQTIRWVLKPAVFLAALVPFALLVQRLLTGNLGADPLEEITKQTGIWTLRFLCITLAMTP